MSEYVFWAKNFPDRPGVLMMPVSSLIAVRFVLSRLHLAFKLKTILDAADATFRNNIVEQTIVCLVALLTLNMTNEVKNQMVTSMFFRYGILELHSKLAEFIFNILLKSVHSSTTDCRALLIAKVQPFFSLAYIDTSSSLYEGDVLETIKAIAFTFFPFYVTVVLSIVLTTLFTSSHGSRPWAMTLLAVTTVIITTITTCVYLNAVAPCTQLISIKLITEEIISLIAVFNYYFPNNTWPLSCIVHVFAMFFSYQVLGIMEIGSVLPALLITLFYVNSGDGKSWSVGSVGSTMMKFVQFILPFFHFSFNEYLPYFLIMKEYFLPVAPFPPNYSKVHYSQPTECILCRNSFTQGFKTDCGHSFHDECLKRWHNVKPDCPECFTGLKTVKMMFSRLKNIFIRFLPE